MKSVAQVLEICNLLKSTKWPPSMITLRHPSGGQAQDRVCTNVSCMLCGSDTIVEYLRGQARHRSPARRRSDGRFTFNEVRVSGCLLRCADDDDGDSTTKI